MDVNPVYRFTIGGKIFVFGILDEEIPFEEMKEKYIYRHGFLRMHDGSNIATGLVKDVQVHDVMCPVIFVLHGNGQMMRTY